MQERLGRDEAGNLWVIDAQGNPIRPHTSQSRGIGPTIGGSPTIAGQLQGQVLTNQEKAATVPFAGPSAQANLQGQNLSNTRTAQDIGLDRLKTQMQLKQQFESDPGVKLYRAALPELAKAMKAGPGKQGDINVIYSFAKVMDPGSVVRGEELDFANASASMIQRVRQYLAMVNQGKGLDPEVRKSLIAEMRSTVAEYNRGYTTAYQQYGQMAQEAGFKPESVIGKHFGGTYRAVEMDYLRKAGELKDVPNKEATARLDAMIRRGVPYEDVVTFAKGLEAAPPSQQEYNAAVQWAKQHPEYDKSLGDVSSQQPLSMLNKVANALPIGPGDIGVVKGGKEALDRAAMGLEAAANMIPGIQSNSAQQAAAQTDEAFSGLPVDPVGEAAGRLGMAGLLSAPIRGPMMAGAVGNMLMSDSNDLGGLASDAVIGGIGGKAGDTALRGIAGLIAPEGREAMRNLYQQGARFSPGQMIGGRARAIEDRFTANPLLGPKIDAIREQGLEAANRIPAQRALGAIGQRLPDNVPAGHDTVGFTKQAFDNEYGNLLNGTNVGLDPTYITRLNAMGQRSNLPPQYLSELGDIIQREVGGAFQSGPNVGQMSGRTYKNLDERLGDIGSTFMRNQDDPFRRDLGKTLMDVKDQTRALLRRQNPDIASRLRAADEGYADYSILRQAAQANPATGIFTPGQLRTAVRSNDRSVGKGATARGEARMQDLASDMSETMPSTVGSSGTSEREQVNKLMPWVIGAAVSPLYSEAAEKVIAGALLRQPGATAQAIADRFRALPRGMFGGGIPLLIGSGQGY